MRKGQLQNMVPFTTFIFEYSLWAIKLKDEEGMNDYLARISWLSLRFLFLIAYYVCPTQVRPTHFATDCHFKDYRYLLPARASSYLYNLV
jgi:hypothetical protein